jgi:hypothetical protein
MALGTSNFSKLQAKLMSYRNQLQPWCIVRHQSNTEGVVTARFRHRSDADSHIKLLTRSNTAVNYSIMFDPKGLLDTNSSVTAEYSMAGTAQ